MPNIERPIKKARDYAQEYQREKSQKKLIGVQVTPQLAEDFSAQCEKDNVSKNALLKKWIEKYTYGNTDQ